MGMAFVCAPHHEHQSRHGNSTLQKDRRAHAAKKYRPKKHSPFGGKKGTKGPYLLRNKWLKR